MKNSFKFLALSLTLLITFAWNYPASPKKVYEHWLGHIERMTNPSTITIFDDQGLNPLTLSQGVENSTGHKRLFWMDPAMLNLNSEEVNLLTVLDEVTTANGKKISEGHIMVPDNHLGQKIMAEVTKANPKDRQITLKQLTHVGAKIMQVKRVDADALVTTNYSEYTVQDEEMISGSLFHNPLANPLEGGEFAYMISTISLRTTPAGAPAEYTPFRIIHSCVKKSDYQQPATLIKI